jgi:flagellar biosynthesis protein FlhF
MAEALACVKDDLGADAVILHTRTFERGGFFGIGRKSVCEITAARASDFPQEDVRVGGDRTGAGDGAGARATASASGAAAATSAQNPPSARASAARRAYQSTLDSPSGDQTGGAHTPRGAVPVSRALDRDPNREGGRATKSDVTFDSNPVFNLEVEREKTKRLAQALSIQLEKQGVTRTSAQDLANANERATLQTQSGGAPTHPVASSETVAQRFILVPKPVSRADAPASAAQQPRATVRDVAPRVASPSSTEHGTERMTERVSEEGLAGLVNRVPSAHAPNESIERVSFAPASQVTDDLSAISDFVSRVLGADAPQPEAGLARPLQQSSAAAALQESVRALQPPPMREARAVGGDPDFGDSLQVFYARLIEQDVAAELATRILREVEGEMQAAVDAGAVPSELAVRESIERRIAAMLPEDDDGFAAIGRARSRADGQTARKIAFIGPTGVGKTTTLAKIAAQLKLKRGLSVGLVAADTYRIAAVDQLRTYAEILEIPVEVAASPSDAARACAALESRYGVDVILIDTAGRSQNDRMKLSELRAFLSAAKPDETHLVLSATAAPKALAREADAFGSLGVDRLILTKLDEAATFGTLLSLVERLGKRVSFLTHGQEVPEHIEVGRGRRLAELVMGREVR